MHVGHLPTPRQVLAPVALLLMGCCLAFGAGPAAASQVSCGDTITADTTLDSDLVNCPNNGIVIGADDITLDLDGQRSTATASRSRRATETSPATSGCSTTATTGSP